VIHEKLEGGEIDVGNKKFGGHEALMVFDKLKNIIVHEPETFRLFSMFF